MTLDAAVWPLLWKATLETLWMVVPSALLGQLLGTALGVWLTLTRPGGLTPNPALFRVLDAVVNVGRSFPFIILMIVLIPLTRALVGTSIGSTAAIVPLTVAAVPFLARLVEGSLREVPSGVTEAARAMGATTGQIVTKVLLPEALPGLLHAFTVLVISLLGYSAVAGAIGAGGLGDLAIRYGYHRFDTATMTVTVVALLLIVQLVQWLGDRAEHHADHR
ncbi:ABC-type transporter, integral membrane subunit (plasmid) [Deinococcus proteolyticus MRP]|uniref:ABC-type transporter, integral membrane subunit n=1 Tax=Deinococcus proteolyticus (strain ATCC 35074 / DSM 20540 / JCM 6276 / NBRC 101906 / NCIMB 13154 / VKM Ac-1939 / CCM 2703 / MRP) TaxID=693977 RepID=F0RPV4_DEIPM|nr:methionine ABC transporter permease [Deinococcus proteolyticus]ADY27156.1 ABC-type transporter, integral membrane subunit [Deinococcus proteolyticus MRP]